MRLQIKMALGLACVVTGLSFMPIAAQASGTCTTTGTARFDGLAERRNEIVPSVHRQLSSFGRMAYNGGCSVTITCVLDPSLGSDSKKIRDRRCSAAKSAMGMFEPRGAIRNRITKEYSTVKVDAGGGWAAGAVYITLQ